MTDETTEPAATSFHSLREWPGSGHLAVIELHSALLWMSICGQGKTERCLIGQATYKHWISAESCEQIQFTTIDLHMQFICSNGTKMPFMVYKICSVNSYFKYSFLSNTFIHYNSTWKCAADQSYNEVILVIYNIILFRQLKIKIIYHVHCLSLSSEQQPSQQSAVKLKNIAALILANCFLNSSWGGCWGYINATDEQGCQISS